MSIPTASVSGDCFACPVPRWMQENFLAEYEVGAYTGWACMRCTIALRRLSRVEQFVLASVEGTCTAEELRLCLVSHDARSVIAIESVVLRLVAVRHVSGAVTADVHSDAST